MESFDRDMLAAALAEGMVDALSSATQPDPTRVEELLDIADDLWAASHPAPALSEDPLAIRLGLVHDPSISLDPKSLKRLRKNAQLTVNELANRLTTRGWVATGNEIMRWESQSPHGLSPAFIGAIAEELKTTTSALISRTAQVKPEWLVDATNRASFKDLAQRWADLSHDTLETAVAVLESRLLATVHRGGRPDVPGLLATLGEYVEAKEHNGAGS